ncbi:hypothetical protein 7908G4F8_7 [Haloquadratum phage sp.]|nr:hypothetical protein 7908G4F8_7 [Haloquadratum phage sp.]
MLELLSLIGILLLGVLDAIWNKIQTGRFKIWTFPFRAAKRLLFELRRLGFTVGATRAEKVVIERPTEEVLTQLYQEGYEPEWFLSMRYEGEDHNTRQYYFDESQEYPHRQRHVRVFYMGLPNHCKIHSHEEPSAIQHPIKHVKGRDMTTINERVKARLENQTDG